MVRSSGCPGLVRIASCTVVQLSYAVGSSGCPSMATIVSPGRRPAAAAGLCWGSAQPGVPASQACPAGSIGTVHGSVPDWVWTAAVAGSTQRSEEHTSELQSRQYLVCRLLLEKKKRGEQKP